MPIKKFLKPSIAKIVITLIFCLTIPVLFFQYSCRAAGTAITMEEGNPQHYRIPCGWFFMSPIRFIEINKNNNFLHNNNSELYLAYLYFNVYWNEGSEISFIIDAIKISFIISTIINYILSCFIVYLFGKLIKNKLIFVK